MFHFRLNSAIPFCRKVLCSEAPVQPTPRSLTCYKQRALTSARRLVMCSSLDDLKRLRERLDRSIVHVEQLLVDFPALQNNVNWLVRAISQSLVPTPEFQGEFVYVLRLKDDCYYVGKSACLFRRLNQHFQGEGAAWTKVHPPVTVMQVFRSERAVRDERATTLHLMSVHGWEHVRGGPWTCVKMQRAPRQFTQVSTAAPNTFASSTISSVLSPLADVPTDSDTDNCENCTCAVPEDPKPMTGNPP